MLNQLIHSLEKEEVRNLKLYLNRISPSHERKDIRLFDYIRKHDVQAEDDRIFEKLYDGNDRNAFYRLKNRLFEDIGKSLVVQHFSAFEQNTVLTLLALSRLFQRKRNFTLAFHYLEKAERKCNQTESYDLLDIIYSDLIRLSHETLSINPEEYISKRKENREKLYHLREIDDLLAVVIYRIRLSQNFSSDTFPVIEMLKKTINEFSHGIDLKKNPPLRFRIYHSVSRILLQQRDYRALEDYLLEAYEEFTAENLFNKNNHDTKLEMLTYLTNSLFKNEKYRQSLEYAGQLRNAMDEFDSYLKDKYLFYYYSVLVNNYCTLDNSRAIDICYQALEDEGIRKSSLNRTFLFLQLSLLHFDKEEYKQANRSLVKLKLEDAFHTLDEAFRLKIAVAELIIRYEMDDHDYVETATKAVEKTFGALLSASEYQRQREALQILGMLIYSQNIKADKKLREAIQAITAGITDEEAADKDLLNYNVWLKKKIR